MKRYVITVPRTTFIVAALAMAVLTLGASIAPARLDSPAHAATTVAYVPVEATTATSRSSVSASRRRFSRQSDSFLRASLSRPD